MNIKIIIVAISFLLSSFIPNKSEAQISDHEAAAIALGDAAKLVSEALGRRCLLNLDVSPYEYYHSPRYRYHYRPHRRHY